MITVSRTTRDSGLTYQRQVELPKADLSTAANQLNPIIIKRKMAAYDMLPFSLKNLNKLFRGWERPRLLVDNFGPIEFSGYLTQR